MKATLPDPFYYLANFERVLAWIGARYADLLDGEERAFLEDFPRLPRAARALLVRMVMRKGPHFRAGGLRYAEIGAPQAAVETLLARGWVDADAALELPDLFAVLTRAEIVAAFGAHLDHRRAAKGALLDQLAPRFPEARRWRAWWPQAPEALYTLRIGALCERLRLLYFGNTHQDWSEFVLADLGIFLYEQVELSAESRAFRTRRDWDEFRHVQCCRERFEAGGDAVEIGAELLAPEIASAWIAARRDKLLFQLAQTLEREGAVEPALALYARCAHAGARSRRIRMLERLERFDEAFALARTAAANPESEAETQALARALPRLHRRLGLAPPARATSPAPARFELILPAPTQPYSVELLACAALARPDAPVHYVENTLLNALFGLLCWDAVFAPLPGAFFHPYQTGPADLLSPDFPARRAQWFDTCLGQLRGAEYRRTIRARWTRKAGIQSPFVHWDSLSETLLEQALACIDPAHLEAIFRRLLADIKSNRAGLPDLIQFWPAQRRYRMVEIKGPGDRLQDNQRRWLDYCARHAIPVEVCHVSWGDD